MKERALAVRVANNSVDAGELASSCQAINDASARYILRELFMFFFSNYGFIYLSAGWAHSAAHSIGGKEHIRYSGGVSSHL
jgi:hypothetical protein